MKIKTNNNTKNHRSKNHSIKVLKRVEVHRVLQHTSKYSWGKQGTTTKARQVTRKKIASGLSPLVDNGTNGLCGQGSS